MILKNRKKSETPSIWLLLLRPRARFFGRFCEFKRMIGSLLQAGVCPIKKCIKIEGFSHYWSIDT